MCEESKQKNDATLTKLGDKFQYFVVLEECIKLSAGEKIVVEQYGDISIFSDSGNNRQIEVKHHIGNHILSDRDIELWNSLFNWVDNYENSLLFKELILYTTSEIDKDSMYFQWNSKKIEEKFLTIKSVGEYIKKREKSFRELYNKIFVNDIDKIKKIIKKTCIYSSQDRILKKVETIKKSPFFRCIAPQSIDLSIDWLLGYLFKNGVKESFKEIITKEDFDSYWRIIVRKLGEDKKELPNEFENIEISKEEEENLRKKTFVKELEKIKYNSQIPNAMSDYWGSNCTIIKYVGNAYLTKKDLENYRRNLMTEFEFLLDDSRALKNYSQIEKSQRLYREVMKLSVQDFGDIKNNRSFFQRGTYHRMVQDDKIKWLITMEGEIDDGKNE